MNKFKHLLSSISYISGTFVTFSFLSGCVFSKQMSKQDFASLCASSA